MSDALSGQRVVLGRRQRNSMTPFRWTGEEPEGLDLETAEGLGAIWEADELVVYDLPGMEALLEDYKSGEFLIDND